MNASGDEKSSSLFSRHNLLSLYLPALILSLGDGVAVPAIPVFAKSFEIGFGVASLVIIMYMVGSASSTVPTGYMIDRIGRRRMVLAGPILTAVSSFLMATARSFQELLVYRFLGGWASQMWTLSRLAIIADTGADRQRGRQITGMVGMERTGRLLGPALGGFTAAWNIRAPFILHGVFSLLAIIPSFQMIKETRPTESASSFAETGQKSNRSYSSLAALFVFPVLILYAAQFIVSVARGSLWGGTLNLYMVYAYDTGPKVLGMLATAAGAIGIPITLTGGYLMDRFGRKAAIVPGFSLVGVSLAFMAMSAYAHLSFSFYVVTFLCVHSSLALTGGSMQTLGSDVAPPDARGTFFGVWKLIGEIGTTISPVLFALISEYYSFTAAFVFLSLVGLSSALLIGTQVKETLRRQTAKARV